jgi:hypothetical protein
MNFILTEMLMMNAEEDGPIMLSPANFPSNYVDSKHPTDLTIVPNEVQEHIYHDFGQHSRLIFRYSFPVVVGGDGGGWIPVSFLVDTGCSKDIWLCHEAFHCLNKHGVARIDGGNETLTFFGYPELIRFVDEEKYGKVNIISLQTLMRLGLVIGEGKFRIA